MIVDEADQDMEMAKDPFLEAGIDVPKELPYQEVVSKTATITDLAKQVKISSKTNSNANLNSQAGEESKNKESIVLKIDASEHESEAFINKDEK